MFVDFDNVYAGLQRLDPAAAKTFAEDPGGWVAALASGTNADGPFSRRFLVQRCYLNPVVHSRYRPNFTRAGFQVVDCPSLTQQGKSSADINLVLDAMDALAAPTHFEEFVILSADADFTPLIARCRAADRQVTIVTPGPAAAAYRAVADTVIAADLFIDVLTGASSPAEAESAEPQMGHSTSADPSAAEIPQGGGASAMSAVKQLVTISDRPVTLANAAQAALRAEPELKLSQWDSIGSFSGWLRKHLPDIPMYTRSSPGYLWDPARFSETDVPHSAASGRLFDLTDLQQQVASITEIPPLDRATYRQLLDRLAFDLATAPFNRSDTSKRVRDDCAEQGAPVSRAAVNFVINGLLLSGVGLDNAPDAETLGKVWADNVLGLCRGARIELGESDAGQVAAWVSGGLVEG